MKKLYYINMKRKNTFQIKLILEIKYGVLFNWISNIHRDWVYN